MYFELLWKGPEPGALNGSLQSYHEPEGESMPLTTG
jgi:hypothetical protein